MRNWCDIPAREKQRERLAPPWKRLWTFDRRHKKDREHGFPILFALPLLPAHLFCTTGISAHVSVMIPPLT